MTIYEVRDKGGVLKFTLPSHMALEIFANIKGSRKNIGLMVGGKIKKLSRFILEEDVGFTIPHISTEALKLSLWTGDKIYTIKD